MLAYHNQLQLKLQTHSRYYGTINCSLTLQPLTVVFAYNASTIELIINRVYFPPTTLNHSADYRHVPHTKLLQIETAWHQHFQIHRTQPPQPPASSSSPSYAPLTTCAAQFQLKRSPALTPFQYSVLTQIQQIPYGTTTTYRAIATQSPSPHAYRAVGRVCATNPLPLLIPCHRVVPSSYRNPTINPSSFHHPGDRCEHGGVGDYQGGAQLKLQLIAQEKNQFHSHPLTKSIDKPITVL